MAKMIGFKLILMFLIFDKVVFGQYCTSGVNFEKYFRMEETLLTYCDVILENERKIHGDEDVHGLNDITRSLEEIKRVHKSIRRPVNGYWLHPINQYHLTKRLYKEWSVIVKTLTNSKACGKTLLVMLQNIEDNIPNKDQFYTIAHSMTGLNHYHGLPVNALLRGDIEGQLPHQNLTLEDVFFIGESCYEKEDYSNAEKWLSYTVNEMKRQSISVIGNEKNISNIMNMLSSAYFKIGKPEEAINTLKDLLLEDPGNRAAQRNIQYYETSKPASKQTSIRKSRRNMEELCKTTTKTPISVSRLNCFYFPKKKRLPIEKLKVKAEVLKRKPLIIYFHDALDKETSDAMFFLGYRRLMEHSTRNMYRQTPYKAVVYDYTDWGWLQKVQGLIGNMTISHETFFKTDFKSLNIGLQSLELDFKQENDVSIGKVITFLSDRTIGGDLVFPLLNIKIPVKQGDMVFFESTVRSVSICPVIYGSQWYGIQEWNGLRPYDTCQMKRRVIPY